MASKGVIRLSQAEYLRLLSKGAVEEPEKPHSGFRGTTQNLKARAKGGRRADLPDPNGNPDGLYVRSIMEANWMRWLLYQQKLGIVAKVAYEPKEIYYEVDRSLLPKRAVINSYQGDFRVEYPDGRWEIHEVKGYMDARSKTKLRLMAKFFSDVSIVVIDQVAYRAVQPYAELLGWE